jgi:hypothetical protein
VILHSNSGKDALWFHDLANSPEENNTCFNPRPLKWGDTVMWLSRNSIPQIYALPKRHDEKQYPISSFI